jgi:hypothetical protein
MRRLLFVGITAAVTVVALTLFLARGRLAELIYRETVASGSESLFLGARDVAELETVAMVHKTVFPHDFFLHDATFYALLDRIRRADAHPHEVLTPEELDHFDAVNLAQEVGLATAPGQPGYVVITTTLRYGYDLSELEPLIRSQWDRSVSNGASPASITIPPARLISQETEDLSREDYPYSPVYLDAEEWQSITTFVSTRLPGGESEKDIIAQATSTGIDLLEVLTTRQFEVESEDSE